LRQSKTKKSCFAELIETTKTAFFSFLFLPYWVEYKTAWRLVKSRIGKRAPAGDLDVLSILMMAEGQGFC